MSERQDSSKTLSHPNIHHDIIIDVKRKNSNASVTLGTEKVLRKFYTTFPPGTETQLLMSVESQVDWDGAVFQVNNPRKERNPDSEPLCWSPDLVPSTPWLPPCSCPQPAWTRPQRSSWHPDWLVGVKPAQHMDPGGRYLLKHLSITLSLDESTALQMYSLVSLNRLTMIPTRFPHILTSVTN